MRASKNIKRELNELIHEKKKTIMTETLEDLKLNIQSLTEKVRQKQLARQNS
tara:strand:- start:3254 stop:3409 length:156 start_codon:yes stop_codon:yes gene_type:complete